MAPAQRRLTVAWLTAASALAAAPRAPANSINFNTDSQGNPQLPAQTASWPEPSTIMLFIPTGLAGDDRMNFKMGIRAWDDLLPKITVQFKDDQEPPDNATNFVNIDLVDTLPGDLRGNTLTSPLFDPPDAAHGVIDSSTIQILNSALGNANLMKNLATHEFGHVLGLDEDPTRGPGNERIHAMDPGFTPSSGYVAPSERDKMMARAHYMVIPTPTAAIAGAAMGLLLVAVTLGRAPRRLV